MACVQEGHNQQGGKNRPPLGVMVILVHYKHVAIGCIRTMDCSGVRAMASLHASVLEIPKAMLVPISRRDMVHVHCFAMYD
jgi:hypothetical protein